MVGFYHDLRPEVMSKQTAVANPATISSTPLTPEQMLLVKGGDGVDTTTEIVIEDIVNE